MRRLMYLYLLVLIAGVSAAMGDEGAKIEMGEPIEFPHAGIALSVPKGFELRRCEGLFDVMRAVAVENGTATRAISLSGFLVAPNVTPADFAQSMLDDLRKNLAIRDLTVITETSMEVAKISGAARLLKYSFRGTETTAATLCFIRELPSSKVRICYLLTVECGQAPQNKVLPIFGEVVGGISLIPLRRPGEIPIGEPGRVVENFADGYSIRPPAGWFVSDEPGGLVAGLCDYLGGGAAIPRLQVIVADVPPETTSRACAKSWLTKAKAHAQENSLDWRVLWEGAVKLADRDAYQFVFAQFPKHAAQSNPSSAPATRRTTSDEPAYRTGRSVIIAQRTACLARGKAPKSYSLVLLYPGTDGETARTALDKISESFAILPTETKVKETSRARTQPSSKPVP